MNFRCHYFEYIKYYTSRRLTDTRASANSETAMGYKMAMVHWRTLKYCAMENTISADILFPLSTKHRMVKNKVVRSVNTIDAR